VYFNTTPAGINAALQQAQPSFFADFKCAAQVQLQSLLIEGQLRRQGSF
jgi:hypothetical protein